MALSDSTKQLVAIALGNKDATSDLVFNVENPPASSGSLVTLNIVDRSQIIGVDSVLLIDVNPDRKFLLIQNHSPKLIWIDFGRFAQPGFPSIRLTAGQTFVLSLETGVSTDSVYAVSEIENCPLIVKEG